MADSIVKAVQVSGEHKKEKKSRKDSLKGIIVLLCEIKQIDRELPSASL